MGCAASVPRAEAQETALPTATVEVHQQTAQAKGVILCCSRRNRLQSGKQSQNSLLPKVQPDHQRPFHYSSISRSIMISVCQRPVPKSVSMPDGDVPSDAGTNGAAIPSAGGEATSFQLGDAATQDEALAGSEKARSKKSRARRLSYVDHREEAKHKAAAAASKSSNDGETDGEEEESEAAAAEVAAKSRSKNARRRRLSYVVAEGEQPALKAKLATKNSKGGLDAVTADFTPEQASIKAMLEQSAVPPLAALSNSDPKGKIVYTMACISRAGREPGFKKQNQDNCFAFEKYMHEGQALFGAFDGHGPEGHTISGYVKQNLPVLLVNYLGPNCTDTPAALRKCFLEVDKAMNATKINCEFSGSTACVAHLDGRLLNVAWVGDSRGVLGRSAAEGPGFEAVAMTTDHKPTHPDEKARIVASSGRVERLVDETGQPIGPFRVWLQYAWIPGLAMSRALGDALAHQVGVSSEPQIFSHTLTTRDAFIILASDGVWEFINSQDAVNIIGSSASAEEGCRQLVDEAFQRWLVEEEGVVDDITAVVVKFTYPE